MLCPSHPEPVIYDLLKLSDAEIAALLERMQKVDDALHQPERRGEPRYPFQSAKRLLARIEEPGGTNALFVIIPRTISRFGIGFLHGKFLHRRSIVEVRLPTINDDSVLTTGQVCHSTLVEGRIHEIGLKFSEEIDLRNFVASIPPVDPT